jgi:hypothetical protein
MLAAYHGHADTIRALLDKGAGEPSAMATARMFERTDLVALLDRSGGEAPLDRRGGDAPEPAPGCE